MKIKSQGRSDEGEGRSEGPTVGGSAYAYSSAEGEEGLGANAPFGSLRLFDGAMHKFRSLPTGSGRLRAMPDSDAPNYP